MPELAPGGPTEDIQGEWSLVACVSEGTTLPESMIQAGKRVATANEITVTIGAQVMVKAKYSVNRENRPNTIDYVTAKGQLQYGIFEVEGDRLKTCFAPPGKPRPTDFVSDQRQQAYVYRVEEGVGPAGTRDARVSVGHEWRACGTRRLPRRRLMLVTIDTFRVEFCCGKIPQTAILLCYSQSWAIIMDAIPTRRPPSLLLVALRSTRQRDQRRGLLVSPEPEQSARARGQPPGAGDRGHQGPADLRLEVAATGTRPASSWRTR